MRTVRSLLAFAVVLAAMVPVAASAVGTTDGPASDPSLGSLVARSLEQLGAPAHVVAAAEDEDLRRDSRYLQPVGDLDGDGLADLLAWSSAAAVAGQDARTLLRALRGFDGQELFSYEYPAAGLWTAVPAQVGPDGDDGLLLISYRLVGGGVGLIGPWNGEEPYGFTNYADGVELGLIAIDASGEEHWRSEFGPGRYVYGLEGVRYVEDLAIVAGTLDARGTGVTDVLVSLYDRTPTPDGPDDRLRTVVLAGEDGAVASEASHDISGLVTRVVPVPDLDEDGGEDYVVVTRSDEDGAGGLRAMRGSDGAALWQAGAPGSNLLAAHVVTPGDIDGDGTQDIALVGASSPSRVAVVDGRAGGLLLDARADGVIAVGDLDGDGRDEVGVHAAGVQEGAAGVEYTAYHVDGSVVHRARHAHPLPAGGSAGIAVQRLGDVDGDGVEDLGQSVSLRNSSGATVDVRESVISGRTGGLVREGPVGGRSVGATIGGQGDDLARVDTWGRSVRDLVAVDGRTGAQLWSTRLRPRGHDSGAGNVAAADVDGDGHADLVVNISWFTVELEVYVAAVLPDSSVDSYVVSGRDGTVLWQTDVVLPPDPPERTGSATHAAPFTWDGTAVPGVIHGDDLSSRPCSIDDPEARCEHVLLELVSPPQAGAQERQARAVVDIDSFEPVPGPVTDIDLYIFDSDEHGTRGRQLGSSTNWFDPHDERVEIPLMTTADQPARFVLVEVVHYSNPGGSGYRGSARLLD